MNYAPHNRIYDNQIGMNYEYQIDFACKFESNEYKKIELIIHSDGIQNFHEMNWLQRLGLLNCGPHRGANKTNSSKCGDFLFSRCNKIQNIYAIDCVNRTRNKLL